MTHTVWFRIALGYLAVVSAQIGAWAVVSPKSFYEDFPGFGRSWVSVDGPYNEHLVRDVGALNLALFVLFVAAAITLSKALVNTAGVAALVWGVPHAIYHLFNTDSLDLLDNLASLGGLFTFAGLGGLLLFTARTRLVETAG